MESKKVTEKDLNALKEFQTNIQLSKISTRNLELEYENIILKLYVKYRLNESDSIDLDTGEIKSSIELGQQ
jgi:hypothetical protein